MSGTTSAAAATLLETHVFRADADTYVSRAAPGRAFGARSILRAGAGPRRITYLRFRVRGLLAPPETANVCVFVLRGEGSARLHRAVTSRWREHRLTYRSRPGLIDPRARSPRAADRRWLCMAASRIARNDDVYSFGVTSRTSTTLVFASREKSGSAIRTAPKLVVETADVHAPAPPADLRATAVTTTTADLVWTASTDNLGVAGYGVFADGVQVATVGGTSASLSGLECGAAYTLRVDAFDASGNRSAMSAPLAVTTYPCRSSDLSVASLWVDPDGGSCTRAAVPAPYDDGSACGSFNGAYRAAQPGDLVLVRPGAYGAQTVSADATKTSSQDVVVRVAGGGAVTLAGSLSFDGADHLTVTGPLTVNGEVFAGASSYSDDVSVVAVNAHRFDLQAVTNWLIKGGSYGDFNGVDDPGTGDNYGNNKIEEFNGRYPQNVVVAGVKIHDLYCQPSNCHAEGLFLWRTRNVTIRNSRFYDNDFYDIFFAGGDDSGTVIENNWFDDPYIPDTDGSTRHPSYGRGTGIEWKGSGSYSNVLVRFNSFDSRTGLSFDGGTGAAVRVVGNLLQAAPCASASYDYNVFTPGNGGATCGGHAISVASFPYVSGVHGPALDYHLTGGSPVDYVPGSAADQLIGSDVDGGFRPLGGGREAGSDELR